MGTELDLLLTKVHNSGFFFMVNVRKGLGSKASLNAIGAGFLQTLILIRELSHYCNKKYNIQIFDAYINARRKIT